MPRNSPALPLALSGHRTGTPPGFSSSSRWHWYHVLKFATLFLPQKISPSTAKSHSPHCSEPLAWAWLLAHRAVSRSWCCSAPTWRKCLIWAIPWAMWQSLLFSWWSGYCLEEKVQDLALTIPYNLIPTFPAHPAQEPTIWCRPVSFVS